MKTNYRFKSLIVALLTVVLTAAPSFAARYENLTVGNLTVEGALSVEGLLQAAANTTGNVYYVDSGAPGINGLGYGKDKTRPLATLDYAIGRCTANNGDYIIVMPGHAETLSGTADSVDVDVAGVTIIGLGSGTDMPEFTYDTTTDEFVIGAANVTVCNLRFVAGVSGVTMGISVEAGGDNFTLLNCEFPEPTTSTFEFVDAIDLASGADGTIIRNCKYRHLATTGPAHFVEAGNGINLNFEISNNDIQGEFSVAAIWSDTIDSGVTISNNIIRNTTSGQHCIEFTTTANGMIVDNRLVADAFSTTLDPGSMYCLGNLASSAIDEAGTAIPAEGDSGSNILGADNSNNDFASTNVAANRDGSIIERSESTIAGLFDAVPNPPTTNSLHDILHKNGSYTYDNTTDSLEAIADALVVVDAFHDVATADAVTNAVMSDVVGNKEDAAAAGAVSTTESIMAYVKQNVGANITIDAYLDAAVIDTTDTALLRDTIGNKGDAAAAGAVTTTESLMAYAKQNVGETIKIDSGSMVAGPTAGSLGSFIGGTTALGTSLGNSESIVDVLYATNGIVAFPAAAAPGNGVSIAEVVRDIWDGVRNGTGGTEPATNKSICDALGTNGTTLVDDAGSIAGMIGYDDNNNAMATSSVVANQDGSVFERLEALAVSDFPSNSHPNYITVTADLTSATWNTATAHEIATVTGVVRMQILVEVTGTVVTTSNTGTMALGYEGNTSAIFAATGLDSGGTTFTAGDVVSAVYGSAATTPVAGANTSTGITGGLFDVVVVGGYDVGYTIGTNAATSGTIVFHIWWEPLSSTGAVTAGAGGAL